MAEVVLALRTLDAEITEIAPQRTLPTWFRGDPAHALRPSGHNPDDTPGSKPEYEDDDNIPEIRAGDFRLPLNASFSAEQLVQALVRLCREGKITWISYIIFKRRIWHRRDGFVTREYTGSNPHDSHFHISSRADTASERNTKKAGLRAILLPPPPPPQEEDMDQPTFDQRMVNSLRNPEVRTAFETNFINHLFAALQNDNVKRETGKAVLDAQLPLFGNTELGTPNLGKVWYLDHVRANFLANVAVRQLLDAHAAQAQALADLRALVEAGEQADITDLSTTLSRLSTVQDNITEAIEALRQEQASEPLADDQN